MATADQVTLYGYWRSSASYRVRLALAFKQIAYANRPVHLINNGGEQHSKAYQALNPQRLLPTLVLNGQVLTQSMAIMEFLEERFPNPALLPDDLVERAKVRALCQVIVADTAPLANLRVLNHLSSFGQSEESEKKAWASHWIALGLDAVEALLIKAHGSAADVQYCFGDKPSLADCCLLPQAYNAERFGCSLDRWPTVRAICVNLGHNEDIQLAKPENQPDAPKN